MSVSHSSPAVSRAAFARGHLCPHCTHALACDGIDHTPLSREQIETIVFWLRRQRPRIDGDPDDGQIVVIVRRLRGQWLTAETEELTPAQIGAMAAEFLTRCPVAVDDLLEVQRGR